MISLFFTQNMDMFEIEKHRIWSENTLFKLVHVTSVVLMGKGKFYSYYFSRDVQNW